MGITASSLVAGWAAAGGAREARARSGSRRRRYSRTEPPTPVTGAGPRRAGSPRPLARSMTAAADAGIGRRPLPSSSALPAGPREERYGRRPFTAPPQTRGSLLGARWSSMPPLNCCGRDGTWRSPSRPRPRCGGRSACPRPPHSAPARRRAAARRVDVDARRGVPRATSSIDTPPGRTRRCRHARGRARAHRLVGAVRQPLRDAADRPSRLNPHLSADQQLVLRLRRRACP